MPAFIDVVRQVGIDGDPHLTVRPDPDMPKDAIQLCTISVAEVEYWGAVTLNMSKELALALAKALHDAAMELES